MFYIWISPISGSTDRCKKQYRAVFIIGSKTSNYGNRMKFKILTLKFAESNCLQILDLLAFYDQNYSSYNSVSGVSNAQIIAHSSGHKRGYTKRFLLGLYCSDLHLLSMTLNCKTRLLLNGHQLEFCLHRISQLLIMNIVLSLTVPTKYQIWAILSQVRCTSRVIKHVSCTALSE